MQRFLISLPDELKLFLKEKSNQKGQTLTALIRVILWEWAEKQKAAPKPEPPQHDKSA